MDLEKHFKKFLQREKIENEKLILAVSGGVDSRVLLEIASLVLDKEDLAVFHLDHGARKNSSKDAEFVKKLCQKKGILFFHTTLKKVPEKNKESVWRDERKKLAESSKKKFDASRILTAHHATDLVETMIFRLVKGAGVEGLAPFDTSTKPFWDIPKKDLEAYAKEKKLSFVKDETNKENEYQRNLIRNKVLPVLREITPNLEKVFVRESEIFKNIKEYLSSKKENRDQILIKEFKSFYKTEQSSFLRIVAGKAVSGADLKDCLHWILENKRGGTQKKLGNIILKKEKGILSYKKENTSTKKI